MGLDLMATLIKHGIPVIYISKIIVHFAFLYQIIKFIISLKINEHKWTMHYYDDDGLLFCNLFHIDFNNSLKNGSYYKNSIYNHYNFYNDYISNLKFLNLSFW